MVHTVQVEKGLHPIRRGQLNRQDNELFKQDIKNVETATNLIFFCKNEEEKKQSALEVKQNCFFL
jgi:hypothetical protein